MAKAPSGPALSRNLTQGEIHKGIEQLNLRIKDVKDFESTSVKKRWCPEVKDAWAS